MVVVCQAHLCAGAYSYLHEFLNLGLGGFCCTPQTPAALRF